MCSKYMGFFCDFSFMLPFFFLFSLCTKVLSQSMIRVKHSKTTINKKGSPGSLHRMQWKDKKSSWGQAEWGEHNSLH